MIATIVNIEHFLIIIQACYFLILRLTLYAKQLLILRHNWQTLLVHIAKLLVHLPVNRVVMTPLLQDCEFAPFVYG